MLTRIVIVVGIMTAMVLWFGPLSPPNWAVVAFVLILFLTGIVISVKRMGAERRVMRTLWKALTGR